MGLNNLIKAQINLYTNYSNEIFLHFSKDLENKERRKLIPNKKLFVDSIIKIVFNVYCVCIVVFRLYRP